MHNLIQFFNNFKTNKGGYVFVAFVIEKLIGLLNTIYVVRLIDKNDFGQITLISSLFAVCITLNGLGSIQGLLRYGALEKDKKDKNFLAHYIFREGLNRHLLLAIGFTLLALMYELKFDDIWMIIVWFSIRFIGYYFYTFILNYYRIHHQNNQFSFVSIFVNCLGSLLTILLTWKFNTTGYLLGLVLTPWLALLFYKKFLFKRIALIPRNIDLKEFWNYSLQSALNYGLAEILLMLDVLFIGLFLSEEDVANYKIAVILPMNLIFFTTVVIQTDFPKLVTKSTDKNYLNLYIKSYHQLFIPLGLFILFIGYFIKDWVVSFVFGENYIDVGNLFYIILIAVVFNMSLRNLYNNLLSAVGLAKENTKIAILSIGLMIVLSFILIPIYGIFGAAIALSTTFILTGFCSTILFNRYLKKL